MTDSIRRSGLWDILQQRRKREEANQRKLEQQVDQLVQQMEKDMEAPGTNKRSTPKISRVIHWRSADGKTGVVSGPFPDGLFRSDTRDSVDKARKISPPNMYVHGATTDDTQYAKVLIKDVIETLGGENDFGVVSP